MAMTAKMVKAWIEANVNDEEEIYIDEGGLTLRIVGVHDDYLEIGGEPDGADSDG